ncbi:MAG TPA: beta-Ala-His dipeptidase, partial [Candidatus Ozemobacteraceae bacterium]|nr:beta-Ala-His dipeptidase [Candidatus Ozemobacteraceae bacterium]
IPRLSGQEGQVRHWISDLARQRQLTWKQDQVGNLTVFVPATPGRESYPEMILHAHMDMVGDKAADSDHDFSRDPIRCQRDGDWLKAQGTTLGADNGIGLSAMLALLDEPHLQHGPLRLLFTVDEEGGFTGADGIDPAFLAAPRLINLDSEEHREFNIGCAGGVTHRTEVPISLVPVSHDCIPLRISISGLSGGHSGVEIHHGRANAIRLLARLLLVCQRDGELRLETMTAGTFDTTIPRQAEAVVWVRTTAADSLQKRLAAVSTSLYRDYSATDQSLKITITRTSGDRSRAVWSDQAAQRLPTFLLAIPAGVLVMSETFADQVETSANPGVVTQEANRLVLLCHLQSSSSYALHYLGKRVTRLAQHVGGICQEVTPYSPWQPSPDSPLLQQAIATHERLFQQPPRLKVVHAGLECGSFARINP